MGDYTIMVVDDTETNIDLLLETLEDEYDVRVATDGEFALKYIFDEQPDLILLDIMMPKMNGYQVCERLKQEENTKDIPVIFLTAMNNDNDEAKGLSLGAVDYITKPFNPSLVKARVQNQLILKRQKDELTKQNEILLENTRLKEDIEQITRHDLKSPLNSIINYPMLVLNEGNLSENQVKYLFNIIKSGKKMLNMINLSLDLYKMEKGVYQVCLDKVNLIPIIYSNLSENNSHFIRSNKSDIEVNINGVSSNENSEVFVEGEELLFYSMLANLIKNAFEASLEDGYIQISIYTTTEIKIEISNSGVIPEEIRDHFFDKYITQGKTGGSGLGTYSAKLIAETLGGTITYKTSDTEGTTIILNFPSMK